MSIALGLGLGVSFTGSRFDPSAPTNVSLPVISGSPIVGQTLTTSVGTWIGNPVPIYTFQWNRDGTPIGGETGQTYVVDALDVGEDITVTVTATNSEGSDSATSAAVVGLAASAGNNLIWAAGNPLTWGSDNLIWGTA